MATLIISWQLAISQRWPSGDNARWSNGGPTAEMTRLRRYANGVPTLGQRPKCRRASVGSHRQANDMRRWLTTFCQRRANVCLLSGAVPLTTSINVIQL